MIIAVLFKVKMSLFLKNLFVFMVIILLCGQQTECSRILCVFPIPVTSHQATFNQIVRGLSLSSRGHEVISVTAKPIGDPKLTNLTEIDISEKAIASITKHAIPTMMSIATPIQYKIPILFNALNELAEVVLSDEEFKKIYNDSRQKFDLIITQIYVNPVLYALGNKLNAPVIAVNSMGGWQGTHIAIGNPNPPALYSDMWLDYNGNDLTIYERIKSTLYFLWSRLYVHFTAFPECDRIAKKYLGHDLPYIADIEKNLSALFLNINPLLYAVRPMVPTVVSMIFIHVQPPKPLPEDLKREIDSAPHGVIYLSLGDTIKTINVKTVNANILGLLLEAIGELPYKVLMKYENDVLPGKPDNVIIKKWLPQQDILADPNVKLFITQGGLQSIEEAIDREMPMLGVPLISDQEINCKLLAKCGIMKQIDFRNTTKEEIKLSIQEVINNPIYKQSVKKIKNSLRDEPWTSMEKVMWWSEYVIRHKGTRHLRSPTVDIEWYKFLLLDVFAVLIGAPILFLFILVKFVGRMLGNKKKVDKNKKSL